MSSAAPMQHVKTDATPTAQRINQPSGQLVTQRQQSDTTTIQSEFTDQRPQATAQRQLQNAANNSPQSRQLQAFQQMAQSSARATQLKAMSSMMNASAVQRVEEDEPLQAKSAGETIQREATADAADAPKPNNTGLPDHLKSGIESLSGMSMDHVKVHYNSEQPAQLNAHAYAQGSEIHVAPGQEHHLPHEAWHVVQQAQGRVKPTMQMKTGVPVNDDAGLETEADVMGEIAMHSSKKNTDLLQVKSKFSSNSVVSLAIQRRGFSYEGGNETTNAYQANSLEDGDLTDGTNKFITVDYEANLPTPREVLLKAYNNNFIKNSLSVTETNFDRPKKVEAIINSKGSARTGDGIETKIGHLGGDEWKIRGTKGINAKYVGGHLIGNQIIGGGVADKAWNIAPQDEKNNSPSYNHTIEQMVRGAKIENGGFINYEVELFYKLENYQVNTQTLIERNIVKDSKLKSSMPAAVQIPTRIPSHWKAKASVNRKAKFAAPTKKKNPGNNEDEGKTYLQYVDEDPFKKSMSESNNRDKEYSNANFYLNFKNSDSKDVSLNAEKLNTDNIQEVSYHMVQEHISTFEDTDTVLTSGVFGSATNYATAESSKGNLPTEIDYEQEFEKLKVKFVQIKEQLDDVDGKYKNCEINLKRLKNNQLYNEWSEFWERKISNIKRPASESGRYNYLATKVDETNDSKKRKRVKSSESSESSESTVKKVKLGETPHFDPTVHIDKEKEKEKEEKKGNLKKQLELFLDKKTNSIEDLKCISMTESMSRNDIAMHDLKKYIEAIDRLQDYETIKAKVTLKIKKLSEPESEPNIETIDTLDTLYKQWQNFSNNIDYAITLWSDNFKLFFLGPRYLVFQEKEYFSVSNPRTGKSKCKTFKKYYEENFDNKDRSRK